MIGLTFRSRGLLMTFVALTVATTTAQAQDSASVAGLTGQWVHAQDPRDEQQRLKAIDAVAAEVGRMMRGRVRDKLKEKTVPPKSLRLKVEGDRFTQTRGKDSITLVFDSKPAIVQRDGKRASLSASYKGRSVFFNTKGEEGAVKTTYRLSKDGKSMLMTVHMSGKRLPKPLTFTTKYRRK